jgi:hypothetical protein
MEHHYSQRSTTAASYIYLALNMYRGKDHIDMAALDMRLSVKLTIA